MDEQGEKEQARKNVEKGLQECLLNICQTEVVWLFFVLDKDSLVAHPKEKGVIKSERKWMYRVALVLTVLVSLYVLYLLTPVWKPVLVSLFKILIPFMIAGLFAYLLHPVIDYLERQGSPRFLSVFIIYTIFFGGGAWLIVEMAPKILEETKELLQTLPTWVRSFNDQLLTIHRQIDTLPPSIHNQIESGVVRLENEGSEMMNGVVDRLPLILEGIAFLFFIAIRHVLFSKRLAGLRESSCIYNSEKVSRNGRESGKSGRSCVWKLYSWAIARFDLCGGSFCYRTLDCRCPLSDSTWDYIRGNGFNPLFWSDSRCNSSTHHCTYRIMANGTVCVSRNLDHPTG